MMLDEKYYEGIIQKVYSLYQKIESSVKMEFKVISIQ